MHAHVLVRSREGEGMFIRRLRQGRVYYLVPGTEVLEGETPGAAAERVALDLLGVAVTVDEMLYAETFAGVDHFFFSATALTEISVGRLDSCSSHDDFELGRELEGTHDVVGLRIDTILAYDVRPRQLAVRIAHNEPDRGASRSRG